MNISNLAHKGFSTRFFAAVTIVSLLLSAFPAAFFVANAANTDAVGMFLLSVNPNPASGNSEGVRLRFDGTGTLNLEGWTLSDEVGLRHTYVATALADGEAYVVCGDESLPVVCDSEIDNGGNTVWNNSGDTLTLRDDEGNILKTLTWGDISGDAPVTISDGSVSVDYAPVTAGPVENVDTGETFATVQEAIDDADTDNGDVIVMGADETTGAQITINKEITLDGNGFSIDAAFEKTNNDNNSAIGVIGIDNVTVQDIVLDGVNGTNLHGLNVYESAGITVDNVTSKNFRSGMVVNGSTVDASDFSTEGNTWHGINVAPGGGVTSPSILNISNTSMHAEVAPVPHIFTDNVNAGPVIEVNDLDSQYDYTDYPLIQKVSSESSLVEVEVYEGPFARAYFLKEVTAPIYGCLDQEAINYDPEATEQGDVICEYEEEPEPARCEVGVNLIQNPSFETPVLEENGAGWNVFDSIINGLVWVVEWVNPADNSPAVAKIELQDGQYSASDGNQYAELDSNFYPAPGGKYDGEDARVKISQNIPTIPGKEYEFSFDFSPIPRKDADTNILEVLVDGVVIDTISESGIGLTDTAWVSHSYTFTAVNDITTVMLADAGTADTFGTLVDNVSLTCNPEPEPEQTPEVCSFAGEVVAITENALKFNGSPVDGNRRTLTSLDSVAPYINFFGKEGNSWSTGDFLTLGVEGSVTYKFTDKVVVDGPGADIAIWEVTGGNISEQTNAKAEVEVSQNGVDFYSLGAIVGDGTVDIAPSGFAFVQYVRVTDDSRPIGNDDGGDGYDIDAITIIDGSCDDYITINTSKIVCDYEEELPNWGAGAANITAATAADWLAENDDTSCRLVDGWEFEWAKSSASNPGNNYIGYGGSNWTTFTTGTAVPLSLVGGKSFWMREVLQDGYLGFGGANKNADESAEMYCHKDVLNYDNFDRVDGPKAGGEYYCVAWNVPEEIPPQTCSIFSDTDTLVVETNEFAVETYVHKNWTDNIEGATWVWATDRVEKPEEEETYTFAETFIVNGAVSAVIEIAADNGYIFTVNGTEVVDRSNLNNFSDIALKEYDILSLLVDGANTFTVTVNNKAVGGSNSMSNPAGVLYRLDIESPDACEVTTEPAFPGSLEITNPDTDGQVLSGVYNFMADYQDADDDEDVVYWAIRAGSCNGVDMVGNTPASPFHVSTFNALTGQFEALVDMSGWDNGQYCLVVNPKEDAGQTDLRETRTFTLMNYEVEPETFRIDGYKYEVEGEGSSPKSGWNIYAENTSEAITLATTTDENGYFYFDVETPGNWEVTEEVQTDWEQVMVQQNGDVVVREGEGVDYCSFYLEDWSEQELFSVQSFTIDAEFSEVQVLEEYYHCEFYNEYTAPEETEEPEEPTVTSRSGGGGSGTRVRQALPTPLVLGESTTNFCPFLIDYMQMGVENDSLEVTKLQIFLNVFKGMFGGTENPVTGTFGATTDSNVKAFQEHFRTEILDPWYNLGIVPHNRPTGFVYKTTLWKINSIVCPEYAVLPEFEGEDLGSNVDLNLNESD